MNVAELSSITHHYGNRKVINTLSVAFEADKVTAIIGLSGSGKSTLLQLINGLAIPSLGTVRIFNNLIDYRNLAALRLKIGYMVQGSGLFPHLTVNENISIASKFSFAAAQPLKRVIELMELVNLPTSHLSKYPYEISGGEQQRVGICRALFLNPPLLLMDEPFGALDPITKKEIHLEIIKLQQLAARSIILVTHDMMEAKRLADNILVLDNGEIQQFDATEIVLEKPANEKVKQLIEASFS